MAKIVVMRDIWLVSEYDPPTEPGWYYCYSLPPHDTGDFTQEHGPFPTEAEAEADAVAGCPANWVVNGDG